MNKHLEESIALLKSTKPSPRRNQAAKNVQDEIERLEAENAQQITTKSNLIIRLEQILGKHRNVAMITCEETCFCWEIERFLVVDCADEVSYLQEPTT